MNTSHTDSTTTHAMTLIRSDVMKSSPFQAFAAVRNIKIYAPELTGRRLAIGTSCLVDNDKAVSCVNALGATKSAVPSTATDFIPLSTPIAGSNVGIVYSPPGAWSDQNSTSDCATSSSLHVTSTINASISVNYTGTSIMVNTMTSSDGGVFSVIIDGFDTMSFVDTYSGPGNLSLPICYPLQFPPFYVQPPEYANRTSHTLELLFIGVSPLAPNGTNTSIGQLGVFAIPNLNPPTSNGSSNVMKNLKVSSLVLAFFYFLLDM
ncbi:hypothetical protein CPB84DRAFT_1965172 [Gymnopilus junonius]|uniref:Uncharacterized protein n=1 Tax=Gymnopilus junonius TaxID=109634 RepID=A0A9P5TIZ9_GYMJU|nr:hypothetical protein CPB84DRAFT_1965172 [Gymnopilus junonius]